MPSLTARAIPFSQTELKRGISGGGTGGGISQPARQAALDEQISSADAANGAWFYTYQLTTDLTTHGFVPMFTARNQITTPNIDAAATLAASAQGAGYLLEYNEPDNTAITAAQAATDHDTIYNNATVRSLGVKLVSISTASDGSVGGSYFQNYLAAMTTPLPDKYAIHTYGHVITDASSSVGQTLTRLNNYQAAFPGVKFWITEFALDDGVGGTPADAVVKQYLNMVTQWFERYASVEKYSPWYLGGNASLDAQFPNCNLYDSATGAIRPIGIEYRDRCGKHPAIVV